MMICHFAAGVPEACCRHDTSKMMCGTGAALITWACGWGQVMVGQSDDCHERSAVVLGRAACVKLCKTGAALTSSVLVCFEPVDCMHGLLHYMEDSWRLEGSSCVQVQLNVVFCVTYCGIKGCVMNDAVVWFGCVVQVVG